MAARSTDAIEYSSFALATDLCAVKARDIEQSRVHWGEF